MSDDLTTFLRARLDEDEVLLSVRHGRAMREIEAKRRIVDEAAPLVRELYVEWFAEMVLWLLAGVYSDHPDYREEWRL